MHRPRRTGVVARRTRDTCPVRLCVYGAGAVGGYLAGFLSRGGAEVSVVARGAHLAVIRADGLRVETPDEALTAHVAASDDPAELGPQDAVLVTVKAPALPDVAAHIGPLLGPDTAVAFVMNGIPWWYFRGLGGPRDSEAIPLLDPGGALAESVGTHRAIGGVFWPACSVPRPGVVRLLTGAGRGTSFGEPDGAISPRLETLAEAFRAADLPVTLSERIRALIWHKLVFNLSAGPLCVLTETMVKEALTESALVAASRALLAEAMALATEMGFPVELDIEQVMATNSQLAHRPSILQDLEAGRRMEIDALYSVPLQMAAAAGISMPTLEALAALIRVKARVRGLY
jgi:2-dehydropantoate 2-reductase